MATKKNSAAKTLKVTMTSSLIGASERQRATLQGLGLRKRHATRELGDTPQVRGMITKVAHMVKVEE